MKGNLKVIQLESFIPDYIDELIQLDKNVLGKYGSWTRDNFLLTMPQKSLLSKLAIINKELVGYIICSSYHGNGHIHRLAVSRAYQKQGIGTTLLKKFAKSCFALGISRITVETPIQNIVSNKFYIKVGFKKLKKSELKDYLSMKDKIKEIRQYAYNKVNVVYCIKVDDMLKIKDEKSEQNYEITIYTGLQNEAE